MGRGAEFIVTAFRLTKEKTIEVAISDVGSYLLELVDHIPANMQEFASARDSLRSEMARGRQDMTMNHWYTYIIDHGDINDYRSRFFGR